MTISKKVADRITQNLKKFQTIAASHKAKDVSEADTVTLVKDMLAKIFGYDKYEELTSEQQIRGTYCDLAVKIDGKIKFLIEVKAAGITSHSQWPPPLGRESGKSHHHIFSSRLSGSGAGSSIQRLFFSGSCFSGDFGAGFLILPGVPGAFISSVMVSRSLGLAKARGADRDSKIVPISANEATLLKARIFFPFSFFLPLFVIAPNPSLYLVLLLF